MEKNYFDCENNNRISLKLYNGILLFLIVLFLVFSETANAQCNAPTGVRGDNASCNGYIARWNGSATKFYLDVATSNTFTVGTILPAYNNKDIGSVNDINLTGLNPNTTYHFRLRAQTSSCLSVNSSTGTFTTLAVAVPTNVRSDNVNWCTSTVRWDGSATKYYLDVATNNTFAAGTILPAYNNLDVANVNSLILSGLSPNTAYFFRVRRLEACGLSGNSSVSSFTTMTIASPTANAGYASCNDWVAQWNRIYNVSGNGADGYYLDVAIDNAFTNYVSGYQNLYVGDVDTYTITGLARGGVYYYRIRAKTSCGIGSNSNVITFTEKGNNSSNPGTITGGATSICSGSITTFVKDPSSNPSTGTWSIFNQTGSATITQAGTVTGVNPGTVLVVFTTYNGCGTSTSKPLTINGGTVSAASSTPTVCANTAITSITHNTNGFTGIGTPVNLPTGVTASFANNVVTISGTPTVSGTFNYNIPLTGSCSGVNATGIITVRPALTNNNLTYGTSVQVNNTATEGNNVLLNAPSGSYFYTVNFASYGTPSGTAPNFIVGSCHASTSQSVTEGYVLGNSTVTIPASNGVFGDPCSGTTKSLYVSATYTQPVCSGTSVTITGSTPTGGNGTYTYEWQSSTTGAAGSFTAAPGTNNTINYTSGPLSQNTYFRRVVTSCTYSSTSTVVFVKLNPDINNNNLSYSSGTSGQLNATPAENANAVLNAPAGTYFATVNFASYGTPSGASPNFIIGGCHSTTSQTVTEGYLLGNSTATIPATNAVFGDPCNGTGKRLYVLATYVQPVCSGTSVTITGTTPTGGNGIYTYVWQSSTTSATSGFAPISGTNTINYTSGALTQTTWFRRVVTSCSSTSTSPVVMVVVNTLPSKPTIGTKTNPTCTVPTGSVVLNGLPSSGSWTITATPNASGLTGLTGTGTTTTIAGLTAGTSYTFAVSNGTCVSSPSEDVVATPLALVTWNGTDWLPSNPTVNNRVEFNGNYSSGSTVKAIPNVDACSCQIKNNAVVVFNAGHTLKVVNELQVVAGTLTFEDDASLVQVNDAAINSGNIIYKRKTTPVNRYDFTYWSSPVRDMTLGDPPVGLSPTTFYDKYFIYNNAWVSVPRSTVMFKGEGYSVRAPQTTAISGNPLPFLATFTGVPHNGEVKKMLTGNGVYLIGNPYPSAIDADQFLALNSSVLQGTLYFWTHNSPPSDAVAGDKKYNYTTNDYATYNRTGGTGAKAAITGGLLPSGKIASAQGFFAPASVAGGELVFNNAMRLSTTGTVLDNTQFFKLSTNSKTAKTTTANTEKNRIWLNLTNSEGAFKQTLIGYVTGATNDYDGAFDGVTYDGNQYVDFYSVNNEVNLSIQGRALPFVKKDSVALGYKSTIKGEFQISIDQTDGVLATQNVFLEDKDLKVIHDLKKASYTFSTEKGAFNNRFVLRYADKNATDEVIVPEVPGEESNAAVIVSVKEGEIKINATVTKLDKVVVYDMAGRKLFQKNKVDANVFFISRLVWNHQALVVDIVLTDGTKHSRKIIN